MPPVKLFPEFSAFYRLSHKWDQSYLWHLTKIYHCLHSAKFRAIMKVQIFCIKFSTRTVFI